MKIFQPKTFSIRVLIFSFALASLAFDANAQWEKQTVNTKASLRGLSVVSEKVVWASGTGGTFIKTVDGGKSWTVGKVAGADELDFRDIEAFDANTAYVLSIGNGDASRIYKTTDGGANWKLQFQAGDKNVFLDAFAFWNERDGIAMGDPVDGKFYLLSTTDGGATWRRMPTGKMPPAQPGEAAFAASGTCIITQGKNNAFLVSGGNAARVFRSTNRGKSWQVFDTSITHGTAGSGIFSIAMFDEKSGVIVGGNYEKPDEATNNLAFTNDGGKTWTLLNVLDGSLFFKELRRYRSAVAFLGEETIVAVGSSGSDVFSFHDESFRSNVYAEKYNSVRVKGNTIWAVGADGAVGKFFKLSLCFASVK